MSPRKVPDFVALFSAQDSKFVAEMEKIHESGILRKGLGSPISDKTDFDVTKFQFDKIVADVR